MVIHQVTGFRRTSKAVDFKLATLMTFRMSYGVYLATWFPKNSECIRLTRKKVRSTKYEIDLPHREGIAVWRYLRILLPRAYPALSSAQLTSMSAYRL